MGARDRTLAGLRAENQRLRDEVARLRRLAPAADYLGALPIEALCLSPAGGITALNQTAAQALGDASGELTGRDYFSLLPAERAATLREHLARLLATGQSQHFPEYLQGRVLETHFLPMRDPAGELTGVATMSVDNADLDDQTPRRDLFLAKLSILLRDSPLWISLATLAEGRFVNTNAAWLNAMGFAREEVLGRTGWELGIWDPDEVRARVAILNAKGRLSGMEGTFFTKTGQRRYALLHQEIISLGQEKMVLCQALDITERKAMEAALRQSEERFRDLFEQAGEGIFRTAPDGRFLVANPALARIAGHASPEDLLTGTQCFSHAYYLDQADRERVLGTLQREGEVRDFEARMRRATGEECWVSITALARRDVQTGSVSFEGFVRDITERKKAEEAILEHQSRLRVLASELSMAEERERRRLAADLHDSVGQALAVAQIKLTTLEATLPPRQRTAAGEVLGLIEQAVADTRILINQLSLPVLNVLGFGAAMEWLAEKVEKDSGLAVSLEGEETGLILGEDVRGVLFRAVAELLYNVVKHAMAQRAWLSWRQEDGWLVVSVSDDGKGFDPALVNGPGATGGFGLFSIGERLTCLGGELRIGPRPGRGTTATLRLPLDSSRRREEQA